MDVNKYICQRPSAKKKRKKKTTYWLYLLVQPRLGTFRTNKKDISPGAGAEIQQCLQQENKAIYLAN